ncbi:hypothetical protein [Pseudomonas aeruginosa]|uniref:hypothetical protein n=1 Tax=Pseudomonas aeruginosa TaxID=287 RepID=UPI000AACC739|nr:hypothetical protein [Pseudomonas aeruginosa]
MPGELEIKNEGINSVFLTVGLASASPEDGTYSGNYSYWKDSEREAATYRIEWDIKNGKIVWPSVCQNYLKESSAYKTCKDAADVLFSGRCNNGEKEFCR